MYKKANDNNCSDLAVPRSLAAFQFDVDLIPEEFALEAFRIRFIEEKFLELFSLGLLNGTVHTCVGQELIAVAVCGQLKEDDWITSNHRCHGHFIAKTKDWKGLIDELMGLKSGVCSGVGSSQHLFANGFISNGLQGSLLPVASGIALHRKINNQEGISVSFIGEGTLGEGVIYEALNIDSLYGLRHLIVCENNFYSQSTSQYNSVSGSILARADAFGVKTFECHTWNYSSLMDVVNEAIEYVRSGYPAFLNIRTYRLNPHSKGDDNRDASEIAYFQSRDLISRLLATGKFDSECKNIKKEIDAHIALAPKETLAIDTYLNDQLPRGLSARLMPVDNEGIRMVHALNRAYAKTLECGAFHVGEDIEDPYGGAFKVTRGLSSLHPQMVKNTPISEAGLVGVAIGMAMMGTESYAEIMFGDFLTNSMDQILNNASKFHHMYAHQTSVPIRIRTPMGGKRGYGPTHSQSLEKHFLGIDNLAVVAMTSLLNPVHLIDEVSLLKGPALIIENKIDYGAMLWTQADDYSLMRQSCLFGSLLLKPKNGKATITVVAYGELARHFADNLEHFFVETDEIPELIVPVLIHPVNTSIIERSVSSTKKILVIEDGSCEFGFGAEILAKLLEKKLNINFAKRVGAEPVPIPSVASLEKNILVNIDKIINAVIKSSKEVA